MPEDKVCTLVRHSLCYVHLDQLPVFFLASLAKPLPKYQHGDKDRTGGKADETGRNESVLQPQMIKPRGNTITLRWC